MSKEITSGKSRKTANRHEQAILRCSNVRVYESDNDDDEDEEDVVEIEEVIEIGEVDGDDMMDGDVAANAKANPDGASLSPVMSVTGNDDVVVNAGVVEAEIITDEEAAMLETDENVVMAESVEIIEEETSPKPTQTTGSRFTGEGKQCVSNTAKGTRCSFKAVGDTDMCQVHYMKSIGKFVKRPGSGRPPSDNSTAKNSLSILAARWEREITGNLDISKKKDSTLSVTALLQLQVST